MSSPNELHVVFGAGQAGARLVTQLLAAARATVEWAKRHYAPAS